MGANNTNPIYSGSPQVDWGATAITTANTAMDGTGTVLTVFTANATNGGYVTAVRFRAAGTNIVTVARIFINNGGANSTPGNNILVGEITLGPTTASANSATVDYVFPMGYALEAGYTITVTIGTTVASGYYVSAIGGSYAST